MEKPGTGRHDAAAADGDHRVLRRLDLREGPTGEGHGTGVFVGIALDVETTGLDVARDAIVELALRRFRYDEDGVVTHVDRSYAWLEDPGVPLPPEISEITGLTDAEITGTAIEDEVAIRLLRSASLVVAHNARFDRGWVERRLPDAAGLDWACSMEEVPWRSQGFDGRSLGFLLCQCGWFHDGHRAGMDVDAVIQLLRHRFADGSSALSRLAETSARPSWIVRATSADFAMKDRLRARGYRWDAGRRAWWREVSEKDRAAEEFWLASHVYAIDARARTAGPDLEKVSTATRFL